MIKQIINLDKVSSTQTLAKEMARGGAAEGTLIIAKIQTAGRGQFERPWDSQTGGLYFSLILRPQKAAARTSALTIKIAETVCEILEKTYGVKSKIKQPNDVLAWNAAKKEYQKICGILTESATEGGKVMWIVTGVGVNLNNNLNKNLPAASIKKLTGREVDIEEFKKEFFSLMSARYEQWLMSV
ncbi:MAG: biotin--[acetyl-CoA-carboxylase] ligase [Elusimicrobium sp.]|jgi:BirA family biotin operon repressor/biotin-[acetyl-CoA-carboxylase] ligase|nr:biotin--[acetyl-CoA-carboxylase] ligase [Elusimicrobium sp.]